MNLPTNAKDLGSIPGSGRFPGRGNYNPFQHSCLETPMDTGAWRATVHGVTKSKTLNHKNFSSLRERQTNKKHVGDIFNSNPYLPCTNPFIIFLSETKLLLKWVDILQELCWVICKKKILYKYFFWIIWSFIQYTVFLMTALYHSPGNLWECPGV